MKTDRALIILALVAGLIGWLLVLFPVFLLTISSAIIYTVLYEAKILNKL